MDPLSPSDGPTHFFSHFFSMFVTCQTIGDFLFCRFVPTGEIIVWLKAISRSSHFFSNFGSFGRVVLSNDCVVTFGVFVRFENIHSSFKNKGVYYYV